MPQTVKLALLDDYQNMTSKIGDWDRLRKRGVEITVFREPFSSIEDAAAKLKPFDAFQMLRERTAFPRALIEKLPNLKYIFMTGARATSLDDKAASAVRSLLGESERPDLAPMTYRKRVSRAYARLRLLLGELR